MIQLTRLIAKQLRTVFRKTLGLMPGASAAQVDDATAEYRTRYNARPLVSATLFSGAVELLQALRSAQIHCAVVTNKPVEIARGLVEQLGIAPKYHG